MKLGATLTMTYPGVPCIYYGDEIGMEGGPDPDNRRTMIWDEARWDSDMRAHYQRLIALRRSAHALMHGGYQLLHAEGDVLAFARASRQQTLIVVAHRSSEARADVTVSVAAAALPDGQMLVDVLAGSTYTVRDGTLTFPTLDAAAGVILEVR
jgi:alpha-glucosidase